MKHFYFTCIFYFIFIKYYSQFICNNIAFQKDTSIINRSLFFQFNSENFLRNNEYFNELYDGITFIGTNINPYISFKFNPKTIFSFGWYGRIFNGKHNLFINSIFYRVLYQFNTKLTMVAGYIYGYNFHQLIEPLYSTDYFYLNKPETGLQFIYNNTKLKSDLWLNWEKFILPNDNFKEEFIIGNNSKIILMSNKESIDILLPINFVAKHKGGQVEVDNSPLQTYFNWASGIDLSIKFEKNKIGLYSYYTQFNDVSHKKLLHYTDGYGIYSNVYFHSKNIELYSGYWFGTFYYSPVGEPLYQSLSRKYVAYQEPVKNLILFKFRYKKLEWKNLFFALQFESYFDYQRKYFDFSYGLLINIAETSLIKELKTTSE